MAAYNAQVLGYVANTSHELSRTAREYLDTSLEGISSDYHLKFLFINSATFFTSP